MVREKVKTVAVSKSFSAILKWLLAPRRRRAEQLSIQEWERVEGIKPRRVKHDWKA